MRTHKTTSFAVLLSASISLISCSGDNHNEGVRKDTPVPVTVAVAGRQSNERIQVSGRIESKEIAEISTRVMGFITGIHVSVGDAVKQGQLLATISNDDILAKKAQAQAMVAEADAALVNAQKDRDRLAVLYEQQSASSKEFENATLNYNSIRSKKEAAWQMQKEAEAMLTYTNLVAPFSGVVTERNMDAGSMATPGMPILIVEQTGTYQVRASVSESEIAQVKSGAEAEVVIKSTGKIIRGSVSEVSPSSKFSGGQYVVIIGIPETERKGLYAGMSVQVSITANALSDDSTHVVLVPASAVVYKDQLTGLYTLNDNHTASLRWVKLGRAYGDQVEILSGLTPSEKFILTSAGKLYNGVPITVK